MPMPPDHDDAQRLPRLLDALDRLGQALTAEEGLTALPAEAMAALDQIDQDLLWPLLAQPSPWLNEVCQGALAETSPDHAMHALRWVLDRALDQIEHDGQAWSVYALNGLLQRRPGEPLPQVLDGLIDQADALSTVLTGEPDRVRFSVQYFTSSTAFPYPEINTWTAALSSIGMPLLDRLDLANYNALGLDDENPADDTPMDSTHTMLLVAVRWEGVSPDRVTAARHPPGALAFPQVWPIAYQVGSQARTVDFLNGRLEPVFDSQATLSCRDDVEAMAHFVRLQFDRLGRSWDGVVAFVYPTHTLDVDVPVESMDVHHLQAVNVVLWAERLEMLIGGYTTRALPGPAVMRLLGSFSGQISALGIPQVHFLPPQPVLEQEPGTCAYLTPVGVQVAPAS